MRPEDDELWKQVGDILAERPGMEPPGILFAGRHRPGAWSTRAKSICRSTSTARAVCVYVMSADGRSGWMTPVR